MSMRLIAALACCTLAMGLTACNKSGKSADAGAMKQCEGGKGECCGKCDGKDASMGTVGAKKEGCCESKGTCSDKASMGAVSGEKAGCCSSKKDASMGAVSGQGTCGSKSSCSSKAGC